MLVEDLKLHHKKQVENRHAAGPTWQEHGLVFAALNGGPLRLENLTRRHFKPTLKAAELPEIRVYDLRHTSATMLLAGGVNPKVVSERLGHSSVAFTLDRYAHVLPGMQEQAANTLQGLLYGP
ncbi:Transposase [compost metagenome]